MIGTRVSIAEPLLFVSISDFQIGSDKYVFHRQGRVNATILTHFLRIHFYGLRVQHVDLAALLHQLGGPDLGLLLLFLSLRLVACWLLNESFVLLRHLAEVLGGLAGFASELGVGRVKGGHIFDELLARLVLVVEFLLVAAGIADGEHLLLLDLEGALGVLALAAENVFVDKP